MTSYASKNAAKMVNLTWRYNLSALTLCMGLTAGFICGIFYSYEWWILSLLFFASIYVLENLRKPLLTGAVADNVPNNLLTSVFSAQSSLSTILTSLIALSLGILADYWGIGMALMSISGGLLVLFGLLGSVFFKKSKNTCLLF